MSVICSSVQYQLGMVFCQETSLQSRSKSDPQFRGNGTQSSSVAKNSKPHKTVSELALPIVALRNERRLCALKLM